jgi:hypothetical protein
MPKTKRKQQRFVTLPSFHEIFSQLTDESSLRPFLQKIVKKRTKSKAKGGHFQNEALRTHNVGKWTKEEDIQFQNALKVYGKKFSKFSEVIKTRTLTQIRAHSRIALKNSQGIK